MYELVNATLTVCRGTTVSPYGSVTNPGDPYLTGVPAALVETSKTVMDPALQTPRTIRTVSCVVPAGTDVLGTDTIIDENSGAAYMIESLQRQPTLGAVQPDLLLVLRERSGYSTRSD